MSLLDAKQTVWIGWVTPLTQAALLTSTARDFDEPAAIVAVDLREAGGGGMSGDSATWEDMFLVLKEEMQESTFTKMVNSVAPKILTSLM